MSKKTVQERARETVNKFAAGEEVPAVDLAEVISCLRYSHSCLQDLDSKEWSPDKATGKILTALRVPVSVGA